MSTLRVPHRLLSIAVVAALVASQRDAAADCDDKVSTCIDSDVLWPSAGPSTFFSIGSGLTTGKGRFGFGLATSAQRRPIVLRTNGEAPSGSVDVAAIGTQINSSFLFSYGITDRFEASMVAPVTFYQNGTGVSRVSNGATNDVPNTAVRDVRLGLAYALVSLPRIDKPAGVAVVGRFDASIPSGDAGTFAGDRGLVAVPTVSLEEHLGRLVFGFTFGARLRKASTLLGATVASQGYAAAGLGATFDAEGRYGFTAEAFTLPSLVAGGASPFQWLVGFNWAPIWAGDFTMHLGGGGTMRFAGHAPVGESIWRGVLDLRYAPRSLDTDGDGVLDRDDTCKYESEDRDGFQDLDGCPDPDNDGDGIVDAKDKCPNDAETKNGFQDDDGCPESDGDEDGIVDEADKCPTKPEDKEGYEDGDGCPEGGPPKQPVVLCADGTSSKPGEPCDVDRDSVPDASDVCPQQPEDKDGIVDDDGCPEKDADEDGVGDELDKCPLEAETIDGKDDADGCPEPGAHSLVSFAAGAIEAEKPVRFAAGGSLVTKPMAAQLMLVAQRLQGLVDRGVEKIVIEAWADVAGENEKNQKLALARAEALKKALASTGIPETLIKAQVGDLGDPPDKTKANWLVTVRNKRKEPLGKKKPVGATP